MIGVAFCESSNHVKSEISVLVLSADGSLAPSSASLHFGV